MNIKEKNMLLYKKNSEKYRKNLELVKFSVEHMSFKTLKRNILKQHQLLIKQRENIERDPFSEDLFEINKELVAVCNQLVEENKELINETYIQRKKRELLEDITQQGSDLKCLIKDLNKSPLNNFVNNLVENTMSVSLDKKKMVFLLPLVASVFLLNNGNVSHMKNNPIVDSNMEINLENINRDLELVISLNNLDNLNVVLENNLLNLGLESISTQDQLFSFNSSNVFVEGYEFQGLNLDMYKPYNIEEDETIAAEKKVSLKELKSISEYNETLASLYEGKDSLTEEELDIISSSYGLPKKLLFAVYMKESQGNKDLVSNKAAVGPFQFLKDTAKDFGIVYTVEENGEKREYDLRRNPFYAADASARYIRWLFELTTPKADKSDPESFKYALAAYNAGLSKVKTKNGLRIPNYTETNDYVEKIIGYSKGERYIVQSGDIFNRVAAKFNLEEKHLSLLNGGLGAETLKAGDFILVSNDKDFFSHKVSSGDTLSAISRKYDISVNEIKKVNNLETSNIRVGQELILLAGNSSYSSKYRIR